MKEKAQVNKKTYFQLIILIVSSLVLSSCFLQNAKNAPINNDYYKKLRNQEAQKTKVAENIEYKNKLNQSQREIAELKNQIDFLKRDMADLRQKNAQLTSKSVNSSSRPVQSFRPVDNDILTQNTKLAPPIPVSKPKPRISQAPVLDKEFISRHTQEQKDESTDYSVNNDQGSLDSKTMAAYELAHDKLKNRDYAEALSLFKIVYTQNPKNQIAANAYYWEGEILYLKDNVKQAAASFKKVVDFYPNSKKMPDAMLRLADAYVDLGDSKQGVSLYQKILKDFSSTKIYSYARSRLKKLYLSNGTNQ